MCCCRIWNTFLNDTTVQNATVVWPIGVTECEDYNGCIGITNAGQCICYQ